MSSLQPVRVRVLHGVMNWAVVYLLQLKLCGDHIYEQDLWPFGDFFDKVFICLLVIFFSQEFHQQKKFVILVVRIVSSVIIMAIIGLLQGGCDSMGEPSSGHIIYRSTCF
jgi:hypothetical protein